MTDLHAYKPGWFFNQYLSSDRDEELIQLDCVSIPPELSFIFTQTLR